MVKYYSSTLDNMFSALSDATRRAILEQLAQGKSSVTELAEPFDISLPAILKHLRVLEKAGLITSEKQGRVRHCHLAPRPMEEAAQWIARYRRFWEGQGDALAEYLNNAEEKSG